MEYVVYELLYRTVLGSTRVYIGYTSDLGARKRWHKLLPKKFAKCMAAGSARFRVLESGLASAGCARAAEALWAARAIKKQPANARGGPWLLPTLAGGWQAEVEAVARARSLATLRTIADTNPRGNLFRHLRGLRFLRASEAPDGAPVTRGAFVFKSRSGVPGTAHRRRLVREGSKSPAELQRLHRGQNPQTTRARETAKRSRS